MERHNNCCKPFKWHPWVDKGGNDDADPTNPGDQDCQGISVGFSLDFQSDPAVLNGLGTPSNGASSIVSWDWDFGDGSPHGTNQNETHSYSPGNYAITLTVVDDKGCTATRQEGIGIPDDAGNDDDNPSNCDLDDFRYEIPEIDTFFLGDYRWAVPGGPGQTFTITPTIIPGSGIGSWEWNWPGGSSQNASPSVTIDFSTIECGDFFPLTLTVYCEEVLQGDSQTYQFFILRSCD